MENMTIEELEKEIAEFKKEKERVRKIIGTIGGKKKTTVEKAVNLSFLTEGVFLHPAKADINKDNTKIIFPTPCCLLWLKIAISTVFRSDK